MSEMPNDLSSLAAAATAELRQAILRAYEAGFAAGVVQGASQMRSAIMEAAQMPFERPPRIGTLLSKLSSDFDDRASDRAPRGAVRRAIKAALGNNPGMTELEIGEAASRLDPDVSSRSVGGELRRLRDRLYRFDGGRWFLISAPAEGGTAGPMLDPAADNQATEGAADDGTPLAV